MEDIHRDHIKNNIDQLISLTQYEKLLNGCLCVGLITPKMREIIEDAAPQQLGNDWQYERHKLLFLKLTCRGPKAYGVLKTLLVGLNYEAAVRLLNNPSCGDDDFISMNHLQFAEVKPTTVTEGSCLSVQNSVELLPLVQTKRSRTCDKVFKSNEIQTAFKLGTYTMKSKDNRGILFLVNIIDYPDEHKHRKSAVANAETLLDLFNELGFKLFYYSNLTKQQFFDLVDKLIDCPEASRTECFVMAIMSWGELRSQEEYIEFLDGKFANISDIEQRFQNINCHNLVDKPKIFFFPSCEMRSKRALKRASTQTDGQLFNIPSKSDMIICYTPADEALYVQEFAKLMAAHAHDTSFEDILMTLHRTLEEHDGRICKYQNIGFNKKLFFNPGIWVEDEE